MTERPELTTRQVLAIAALLQAPTMEEAAIEARVSPRTLRRWLGQPVFRAELRRRTSQVVTDATSALAAGVNDAAAVLRSIATNRRAPTAPRVAAARAILDLAAAFDERSAIVQRLEQLEAKIAGRPETGALQ